MSGFLFFNVPTLFMLLCLKNTPSIVFSAHFLNESYNAGLNYAHRNSTSNYTNKDVLTGYVAASTSSVSIALGL
jgi:hypothetical protein